MQLQLQRNISFGELYGQQHRQDKEKQKTSQSLHANYHAQKAITQVKNQSILLYEKIQRFSFYPCSRLL